MKRRRPVPQPAGLLNRSAHLALALLFLAQQSAWAAVIPVDGFDSTVADDGVCTLREAMTSAETDTASGAMAGECPAGSGADTVTLTGDVTLTVVDNTTVGGNSLPLVTSDVTVEGGGHTVARSSAGGTPDFRLFHVAGSGTLTLNDIGVTNGKLSGSGLLASGGGVLNRFGTVTLTNSTVSGNLAAAAGGGVYSEYGTTTLTNSTVSGNSAVAGGGILLFGTSLSSDTVTLTNSTVSGNSATRGGGLCNYGGAMTLTNSTVSGNSATRGGGLYVSISLVIALYDSTVTLTNSTVSGNSAATGGGILNSSSNVFLAYSTVTLTNSTLSGNSATVAGGGLYNGSDSTATVTRSIIADSTGANCDGPAPVTDNGNNFADDATCGVGFAAITPGVDFDPILTGNGGPTQTHALLPGSVAIDAAGACGLAADQRGVTRPQGPACDSGAFEVGPCGDGVVDAGEACDDGNTNNGDCCTASCQYGPGPGNPPCCSLGVCQVGQGCGAVCFTPGGECQQPGGPGTACLCAVP